MYDRFANYVITMPRERLPALYLEDIALCAAWYESHQENEEVRQSFGVLREIFDMWVHCVEPPRTDTMGYRQQPLIRQLIKRLGEGEVSRLERDELDLLYFAAGLARRSGKLHIFRRVLTCLAPHTRDIEHWRKRKALAPGCPALSSRLAIVTDEDLKSAESRDVRTFGGLSLRIRGPVFLREGDLRILSDIPPDCTVVVDQGSCYVRGNVLGNLAATIGCEVLENIGGVVIARRGNVCAKEIVNQSTVVSKEGSVYAIGCQNPKLVFASREIHLQGNAIQGRYMARKVRVDNDFIGGDLFATEWAEAENYISSDERPLRICLLRGLSCQDYGEVLSMEAARLHNSAMKLRQRVASLEELIEITEREADDLAGNILMYILGEEDTQERIHLLQKKRRRQSFLERLVTGVRSVMVAAEDRINAIMSKSEDNESNSSVEDQATLDDLKRELAILSNEGSIDVELQQEKDEILHLGRKLQRKGVTVQGVERVLERLMEKSAEIEEKNKVLKEAIDREEAEIERTMVRAALLDRAKAECSRVEMLKQLLVAARKRPNMDLFRQRANDRYVKLLQRTMENRLSRTAGYLTSCKEVEERIEHLRERLWTEYMVSLPDHVLRGWAVDGARVKGCFSAGVLICSWRHLLEDDQQAGRSRIVTSGWGSDAPSRQIYLRTESSTIEPLGPPEPVTRDDTINI